MSGRDVPVPDSLDRERAETTEISLPKKKRSRSQTLLLGLTCHKCGHTGSVYRMPNRFDTDRGPLDLPYYHCMNCDEKWFAEADVLVVLAWVRFHLESEENARAKMVGIG